jgi:phosphate-selective porin OprO/OprP
MFPRVRVLAVLAWIVIATGAWAPAADVPADTPLVPAGAAPAPAGSPAAAPSPAAEAPAKAGTASDKEGFHLQSAAGHDKLTLRGYVQADGRFTSDDTPLTLRASDGFLLRRVRPILQGTVAQYFDFYVNPDFGGGTFVLQDAYIDVNFTPKLRVRAGKMKTPFGIERLQSGASLWFVERALPTNLVPNRDVGLQLHGELGRGVFGYQLAVLNGVPDGGSADGDTNDSKDLAGRIFFQPWKKSPTLPLRGFGFGLSSTRGKAAAGSALLSLVRSVSQVVVFNYLPGVTAAGDRTRLSPQAWYFLGRGGVLAEYVESRVTASRQGSDTTTSAEVRNKAWSVSGSFFLTGEAASYGSARPRRAFVPSAGAWGALQLVARVNRIDLDPAAFTNGFADPAKSVSRAAAWGVGLNWIWNTNLECVLDFEVTRFRGGAADGADRATERSIQSRLQLSF